MKHYLLKLFALFILLVTIPVFIFSQESYEDYLDRRYDTGRENNSGVNTDEHSKTSEDTTLSEIRPVAREDLLEDLRNAVRDEIDVSLSKERKARTKNINKNDIVNQVRSIVKEEIEDAIKLKQSRYLKRHTMEAGGFISYQTRGVDSSESDYNKILRVFPQFSYFFTSNLAITMKGEAEFNLTNKTKAYSGGIGPKFVFGITEKDTICFYADMMLGFSHNSLVNDKVGYRYSNGMGLKFLMNSGVILNAGVQLVFDNLGSTKGFQNVVVPTVGITAWF